MFYDTGGWHPRRAGDLHRGNCGAEGDDQALGKVTIILDNQHPGSIFPGMYTFGLTAKTACN